MKKTKLSLIVFILILGFLTNCKKENQKCSSDADFCTLIKAQEYNETGLLLDNYLSGLNSQSSDVQKLEQLKDWLECKSCVINVEILCISCIYTNPPKSVLKVLFVSDEQQKETLLYIIMDNPLRFGHYDD